MSDTIQLRIKEAAEALRGARSIAAAGHVGPDGDALGSALAIAGAARAAGIDAVASFGEPFVVPDVFDFLPLDLLVPPGEFPARPDVMVACDTASPDRLGSLSGAATAAGTLVVLDHHPSNPGFGDIAVIDPQAASTAEIAYRLIRELGWPIDVATATALYTGVVTDTGRFQYSSTSPGTMRMAAELLEIGVRPEEIGQQLYERVPFGYLQLAAAALGRAVLDEERSLIWTVVTTKDLKEAGIRYDDADPLIDDLRIAREAGVALLVKEFDGAFKGSLRSRGEVDVGAIAVALGGGGHHNAAGFTYRGSADDLIAAVRSLLDG